MRSDTDITFEEDDTIVRKFSFLANMGTVDDAAGQMFNRDENSASPKAVTNKTAFVSSSPHGYWTTDPSKEVTLRVEDKGAASETPCTIIAMFQKAVEKFGSKPAISVKKMNTWNHWTYEKYFDNCKTLAKAFIEVMLMFVSNGLDE